MLTLFQLLKEARGILLALKEEEKALKSTQKDERAARNTSATLSSRRKSASSRRETATATSSTGSPSASSSKPLVTSTATSGPLTSQSGVKVEAEGRVGEEVAPTPSEEAESKVSLAPAAAVATPVSSASSISQANELFSPTNGGEINVAGPSSQPTPGLDNPVSMVTAEVDAKVADMKTEEGNSESIQRLKALESALKLKVN